jgi:predicted ATPase
MREYGLEELAACGELESCREAHASYYLALARRAEPALYGAEQGSWEKRLERDYENIRAAFLCLLEHHKIEEALILVTALLQFWLLRGHLSEGLRFLEQALEVGRQEQDPVSP